jgi:hypothetical protein
MGYTSGLPTNAQASSLQDWAIIEPSTDNRNRPFGLPQTLSRVRSTSAVI